MSWTFYIQPNSEMSISSIEINVAQILNITKEEVETTNLGQKVFNQLINLWRLENKRERKTYKWDMWALNKASDKARKQLSAYTVTATVKLKWKKEPLVYEERMRVE